MVTTCFIFKFIALIIQQYTVKNILSNSSSALTMSVAKQNFEHNNTYCLRSHPIVQGIVKEYRKNGSLNKSTIIQHMDDIQCNCQCRRALRVVMEAANLKKWMRLLFLQHQTKFNKHSIRLPEPYEQIKLQIQNLIQSLEQKIIITVYQSQRFEDRKNILKRKSGKGRKLFIRKVRSAQAQMPKLRKLIKRQNNVKSPKLRVKKEQ